MLESKRKRLQIPNIEGYVVEKSSFTSIAFTKNYEINIHEDEDDDDLCFILCLQKGIFNTFLCFSFGFIWDCSLFALVFDSLCLM